MQTEDGGSHMAETQNDDFISAETEKKIKDFEAKLRAEQAAMPDTSIRGGSGSYAAPEQYYFRDEKIPIYDTGLNKQIDRIDMEVDKARRNRNTIIADEVDRYMREIRLEIQMKEEAQAKGIVPEEPEHKTAPGIYIVPGVLGVFGLIVIIVMSL